MGIICHNRNIGSFLFRRTDPPFFLLAPVSFLMPRYRITVEYDGTPFVGWQSQDNGPSVQGRLEDAIKNFSSEGVRVKGAGRTDAGVHALGQVAHFDLKKSWDPLRIREAMNFHLRPDPIAVLNCGEVPAEFDARFSATARHYLYKILNRRAPTALDIKRVWRVQVPLDFEAMNDAAQVLVGHHDFTTFRASACQANSPMRTLAKLDVFRHGEEIHIEASARSFLHNQIRSLAGTLKMVGEGKWTKAEVKRALECRDRKACAAVAPPYGLYLIKVEYPEENRLQPVSDRNSDRD